MTLQGAKLVSFCETLPSRRPDSLPRPRLPTTRRSAFSRSHCVDNGLGWVAPSGQRLNGGNTPAQGTLPGPVKNFVRRRLQCLTQIAFGTCEFPQFRP